MHQLNNTIPVPVGKRILLRQPPKDSEPQVEGIYIPDSAVEAPTHSVVVATGNNVDPNLTLSAGTLVMCPRYAGVELKHDGEEYRVVSEEDILVIFKEDPQYE